MLAWNAEYWDTMWEYFWSPNWLGCKRIRELCPDCKKRRPSKEQYSEAVVMGQLRKREEPLNHMINIFLHLLPDQITSQLFSIPFKNEISDRFLFMGAEIQTRYAFRSNVTQQDVFLVGPKSILCVEIKLDHRSELLQIAKYALLCVLEEKLTGRRDTLRLVYLTPDKPFAKLWKEGFQTEHELQAALHKFDPATAAKKSLISVFTKDAEAIRAAIKRLEIGFMTYTQLADALEAEKTRLNENLSGDQTLGRLIDGILSELRDRRLVRSYEF